MRVSRHRIDIRCAKFPQVFAQMIISQLILQKQGEVGLSASPLVSAAPIRSHSFLHVRDILYVIVVNWDERRWLFHPSVSGGVFRVLVKEFGQEHGGGILDPQWKSLGNVF